MEETKDLQEPIQNERVFSCVCIEYILKFAAAHLKLNKAKG
jgi:hypothetical protein